MTYLLIFFASLITTIFCTPFLISFLKKTKIVDYPGGRKIHSSIIPSMGGLIIYLIVLVMLNAFIEDFNSIKLIIISVTLLVFSGIVDDVLGLNNFVKFIIQNISAVLLILYLQDYYNGISLFGIYFESPFSYLLMLVFIVGAINSINFLDGLDGLASGFAILIFSVLLALAIRKDDTFLILLTVSLLGSTLGFLRFNAFPASVFLGDTGSLVLGFFLILASCLTSINYHEEVLDLTFPLILLGVPLIDTFKVFILRIVKRRDPFTGDTSHQHHILKKSLVSHEATVFIIELFSLLFIFLALLYLKDFRVESIVLFFVFGLLFVSLHPIFAKVSVANKLNSILINLHGIPIRNLFPLIKILLIISSILIILIFFLAFSFKTSLVIEELIFLLIMVASLLGLSVFQFFKDKTSSQLNVFLNFAIFFIISKLSLPSIINGNISLSSVLKIHEISFYILSALIAITLVLRWKALMTKKLFFNGMDLTIIVFMLLTFIINNILQFDLNYYLSISLLEAFIFYVWYKLVVDMKKRIELKLTLTSFILPISLLISLIISTKI